ncbi:transposon Ty3-G Gag-Pol polyprotein [Nephila pilipes]|uniref:Transposon Ty3-G Gag-Pol polyprotein n=1 Tax=Nephila pilipes TaxID=299642 RepID=A0A8X6QKP2_NEPPI|nr:transposon Ty3-G Gag-Pol polyprotein [Nephila pilipes]
MRKSKTLYYHKKMFPVKQPPKDRNPHFQRGDKVKKESSEVVCYGCGTPGVIKPKYPSCKGKNKKNHGTFSSLILQSASCPSKQLATLEVTINGVMGTACADTAATHSIAGETLYNILRKQGTNFTTGSLTVSQAEGSKIEKEVNTTCVKIRLGGRILPLNLVAIPGGKTTSPFWYAEPSACICDSLSKEIGKFTSEAKKVLQEQQDKRKSFVDKKRRPALSYSSGDLVLVTKPNKSNKNARVTSKFMPRRDGPFVIVERKSPVSYFVANTDSPQLPGEVYYISALTPFQRNVIPHVKALRIRGRPARIIKPSSPTPANAQIHKG